MTRSTERFYLTRCNLFWVLGLSTVEHLRADSILEYAVTKINTCPLRLPGVTSPQLWMLQILDHEYTGLLSSPERQCIQTH
jgi:hypothetical protein